MLAKVIHLLGGYTKDDILAEAMKELFNTITEEDVLRDENGVWVSGGRTLTDAEKKLLISEASVFVQTRLWKELQKDVRYRANKAMYEKAKTIDDLLAGKMALYILDVIKTRLESLTRGRGAFNSDTH